MWKNHRFTMKTTAFLVFASLCYTLSLAGDDNDDRGNNFRILVTGNFHGADIKFAEGNPWLGLFKTDSGYVLEQVTIITKPWHDVMLDSPGETTGVSIDVEHDLNPIFLVTFPRVIQQGPVKAVAQTAGTIEPGKLISLENSFITALGQVTDEGYRHPGDLLILNYQIMYYKYPYAKNQRQILKEYERVSYEGIPYLIWAGDLDRDGQIDLLLDIRNSYTVRHYALFLSSEADTNRVLKLVADLYITGC